MIIGQGPQYSPLNSRRRSSFQPRQVDQTLERIVTNPSLMAEFSFLVYSYSLDLTDYEKVFVLHKNTFLILIPYFEQKK